MASSIVKFGLASIALMLAVTPAFSAGHILKPVGRIGVSGGSWMSFVAFSPDGKMVASDGPAKPDEVSRGLTIWAFPKGRFVRRVNAVPDSLSPSWKYVAAADGIRRLKDDGLVLSTGRSNDAHVFSPDDRFLAVLHSKRSNNEPNLRVLSLPGTQQVSAFGSSSALSVAFSPNDKLLAAGHWDSVALWDIATRKRVAMLRGFGRYVNGITFSPRGTLLAAGTDLGTLQIWDVRRRKRLHAIDLQGGDVSEPAFSPDGKLVAVGVYGTGTVWLVDVRSGKIIDHAKVSDLGCGSVAFSPDGRFLIVPSTGGLVTWPYDQGGTIRVFRVAVRSQR